MKKVIATVAALFASASLFAFDFSSLLNEMEVGARLSFDLNIFDFNCGDIDNMYDQLGTVLKGNAYKDSKKTTKIKSPLEDPSKAKTNSIDALSANPGFGINLFAGVPLPFVEGLGAKVELAYHLHGIRFKPSEGDDFVATYNTLDIPLLATYKYEINDMFYVQPELGPKFSFTLGNVKASDGIKYVDDEFEVTGAFNFGIIVGATVGIRGFGPGTILANIRYNRDFTKIHAETTMSNGLKGDDRWSKKDNGNLGSGQSFDISVGYQMKVDDIIKMFKK